MKRVFPLLAASVLSLGVMSCSDDGDDKKDSGSAVDPLKAKLSGTWIVTKSVDKDGNETIFSLTPGDNEEFIYSLSEFDGNNLKIHELVDSENYLYTRTTADKFEYISEGREAATRTIDYTITDKTITADFDGDSKTAEEVIEYSFSDDLNTLIEKDLTDNVTYYSVKYDGTGYPAEWADSTLGNPLEAMSKTDLLAGEWKGMTETGGGENEPADEYTAATVTGDASLLDITLKRKMKHDDESYRTAAAVVSLGDIDLKKISNIIISYQVSNENDTLQLHFSNSDTESSTSLDDWATGDKAYGTFQLSLNKGVPGTVVTDTICVANMSLFWWGDVETDLGLKTSDEEWGKWAPYYNFNDETSKETSNLHLLEKEKFVFITNYNDDWKTADESFNVKISKFEVLSLN